MRSISSKAVASGFYRIHGIDQVQGLAESHGYVMVILYKQYFLHPSDYYYQPDMKFLLNLSEKQEYL